MQIALEKEFQAKEQLLEENNSLRQELDVKQHRILDLQTQIEQINGELARHQLEIADLRVELEERQVQSQKRMESNFVVPQPPPRLDIEPVTSANKILSSPSSSSTINTAVVDSYVNTSSLLPVHINNSSDDGAAEFSCAAHKHDDTDNYSNLDKMSTTTTNSSSKPTTTSSTTAKVSSSVSSSTSAVSSSNEITASNVKGHKFEVVSFSTIERCEYCCSILYGICRQAVRCREKTCNYLCHPKCRQYLPTNCPININQRVQLKGVDFTRGIGTLMQGTLKVPKLGGVKKGWQEHFVLLSNARLFVCPIVDNRPSLIPVQIVDIRDPQFTVGSVSESDVIHASKKDIPCIMKVRSKSCQINNLTFMILCHKFR
jgi:serine/threonine-protein kinase MRCK